MSDAPNGRKYADTITLDDGAVVVDVTALAFTDDPAATSPVTEAFYRITDTEGRRAFAVLLDGQMRAIGEPLAGSWGDAIRAAVRG
ncbi:MAG TPA: hypothetical protein VFF43_18120, partial [Caldimonas sp.]|nr:hypothetical protein [Caldimonas sp.]